MRTIDILVIFSSKSTAAFEVLYKSICNLFVTAVNYMSTCTLAGQLLKICMLKWDVPAWKYCVFNQRDCVDANSQRMLPYPQKLWISKAISVCCMVSVAVCLYFWRSRSILVLWFFTVVYLGYSQIQINTCGFNVGFSSTSASPL